MMADAGRDNAGPGSHEQDAAGRDKADFAGANARAGVTSDLPDPRKLAQDWITLWQSELSAMAADPEMRESWQTLMAIWAGTMSAVVLGLPRASPEERHANRSAEGYGRTNEQARTSDAPRAAPTAAASDARDAEIERLARHVATLERRLADLERGGDPSVHPKRRPGRKPRK